MIYTIIKQDTDEVVARIDDGNKVAELGKGYAIVTSKQEGDPDDLNIKPLEENIDKKYKFDSLGIPLTEVGERLHALNKNLEHYGILLQRDVNAGIEIAEVKGEDLAISITITASLFEKARG